MSSIPVQNIYYMFCYAWKHFKSGEDILVGADSYSSLFELLVKVFLKEASTIVRRGLDQEYITEHEDLASPKGKILIGDSIKRNLITRHRLHCAYDELSSNILHNQIVKACLERIMQSPDIDKFHRDQAKILSYRFKDVASTNLKAIDFLSLRLHRNNSHYKLALKIGELIYNHLLPEEGGAQYRFNDILNDRSKMGDVFEEFVRNFYDQEQHVYKVGAEKIRWDLSLASEHALRYLPDMNTDISLTSPRKKVIIDTKFYKKTLNVNYRFGEGVEKIHSDHLYQLFSYLKNTPSNDKWVAPVEGILLYPTVTESIYLEYIIQGHRMRIISLDLNQDWKKIRDDLLQIISA